MVAQRHVAGTNCPKQHAASQHVALLLSHHDAASRREPDRVRREREREVQLIRHRGGAGRHTLMVVEWSEKFRNLNCERGANAKSSKSDRFADPRNLAARNLEHAVFLPPEPLCR